MSQFNPLVSIVIPVYNGANFLREAIDSALAQTYQNIEVVVVNDGSDDDGRTEAIAKSYDDRISYFYKENGGVATALNYAISKAKGEYISWLSHDDLYYPDKIEVQVNCLKDRSDRNIILFSNFDVKDYVSDISYTANLIKDFEYTPYGMLFLLFSSSIHGCSMLIPKEFFNSIGTFSVNLKTTQDYDFLFRLFKKKVVFHYIPQPLILTRHHKDQGTHQLMDYHLQELNDLYVWAFKQFYDEFQALSIEEVEKISDLMSLRGIVDAHNLLCDFLDYKSNKSHLDQNLPVIWLYWENQKNKKTPHIIDMCWNSIETKNSSDFRVIKTNLNNIFFYLPELTKDVLLFEKIAHRADFIRFNLLYQYGGIWLDSDFVSFKSLNPVLEVIEKHGFVYTGYLQDDGQPFPIIHFLGAKRHNAIAKELVDNTVRFIEEKLKKGIQPEWDEIGGYALQKLLTENNSYMYNNYYFSPVNCHSDGPKKMLLPGKLSKKVQKECFGQMLPFSVYTVLFDFMGKDVLKMSCYLADILKKNVSYLYRYSFLSLGLKEFLKKFLLKLSTRLKCRCIAMFFVYSHLFLEMGPKRFFEKALMKVLRK